MLNPLDDRGAPRHGAPAPQPGPVRTAGLPGWLSLALLLLGALAVRVWHLDAESLWGDEIRTARLANLPTGELLQRIFVERQFAVPVLHLFLCRLALAIDPGDFSLRMVSVLAGVAGVAAVLALGREVAGARAGWVAAALLAVAPGHIFYSREARPYALLVLVVALLLWAVARAQRTGSLAAWLGAGALAVVACLTSFLAVFPAAATVLVGVACLAWRRRWRALALLLLPAVLLTPAWLTILALRKDLVLAGEIPTRLFEPAVVAAWTPLLGPGGGIQFTLAAALGGLGLLVALRTRPAWALVAATCFALTFAAFGLLPFNHGFAPRYLLFLLVPFVVLQAQGLLLLADAAPALRARRAAVWLTLALVALNVSAWKPAYAPWRRDWRGAAAAILERWPDEVIVLSSTVSTALPTTEPTVERLGYYLGDRDGYSPPERRLIVPVGRLAPPWLEMLLGNLEMPVCAVLLHDTRRPPELPEGSCALRFHGILVLVDDHPGWGGREQAAWLLMAQAWAAVNPEEQRWLLGHAGGRARPSAHEAARAAFSRRLAAFLERSPERFSSYEHALLDCIVDEFAATPARVRPVLIEELLGPRVGEDAGARTGAPAPDDGSEDSQGF